MHPLLKSLLGAVAHSFSQEPSPADKLLQEAHILRCNCPSCIDAGDVLRLRATSSHLNLVKRFEKAPLSIQFRALMEDYSLERIKAELEKVEETK